MSSYNLLYYLTFKMYSSSYFFKNYRIFPLCFPNTIKNSAGGFSMLQSFFLASFGICCGVIVAGGIVGLLTGLSIIPRYAEITHTSSHLLLYEDAALLGTVFGNALYLFRFPFPAGSPALLIMGLFFGIFLGSWILALAEILSVFPVFSRRIRLNGGFSFIIISIALGKTLGCLLFYYLGWA